MRRSRPAHGCGTMVGAAFLVCEVAPQEPGPEQTVVPTGSRRINGSSRRCAADAAGSGARRHSNVAHLDGGNVDVHDGGGVRLSALHSRPVPTM
eukprot:12951615-Alexandrium_andersonii.AAC.1